MAQKMIEKRTPSVKPYYFTGLFCVVLALFLPMYRPWAAGLVAVLGAVFFFLMKKRYPGTPYQVPAPEEPISTGDSAIDETLNDINRQLGLLRQLDDFIEDEPLSICIRRMVKAGEGIVEEVTAHPEKGKRLRRFTTYYLPMAIKILSGYARMTGRSGDNAEEVRREVEKNADTIAAAFESQYDSLFEAEALDLTTDIEVLKNMMQNDSLT